MKILSGGRSFVVLSLLCSGSAFAGGASHGGAALVCRDGAQKILSAEVLDLFEARELWGTMLLNPSIADFGRLRNSVAEKTKSAPHFAGALDAALALNEPEFHFIGEGIGLELTKDVFPTITRPGCKIEQLAVFKEDAGIFISTDLYRALSPLNQLALRLHEAVYLLDRKWTGAEDSVRTREIVGYLLSSQYSEARFAKVLSAFDWELPIPGTYQMYEREKPTKCTVRLSIGAYADVRIERVSDPTTWEGSCTDISSLFSRSPVYLLERNPRTGLLHYETGGGMTYNSIDLEGVRGETVFINLQELRLVASP